MTGHKFQKEGMKFSVDLAILVVCGANTLGVILLLIFYCVQVRFLKKRLINLGLRPAVFKTRSDPDILQMQAVKTRPRSNSWAISPNKPAYGFARSEKNTCTEDSESSTSSSVSKYPIPPLPKAALKAKAGDALRSDLLDQSQ